MKKFIFLAAAATMLFAACNKTEVVYSGEPQEIAMYAVSKVATKAPVAGTAFNTEDNMRVSAYLAAAPGNDANVGEYFKNIKFTDTGAYWTGGQYWPLFKSTINFMAVTETGGKVDNTTVAFGSTAYAEATLAANNAFAQNDLMYAVGQGSTDGTGNYNAVPMKFHHALSWVNFAFKSNLDGVITVKSVELTAKYNGVLALTFADYNTTTTLAADAKPAAEWLAANLEDNKAQLVPNADHNAQMAAVTLSSAATYAPYGGGLMVVPGNFADRKFVITYDVKSVDAEGNPVNKEFTYTYPVAQEWEMAKKYTYNINITLDEIEIDPSVEAWDPQAATEVELK